MLEIIPLLYVPFFSICCYFLNLTPINPSNWKRCCFTYYRPMQFEISLCVSSSFPYFLYFSTYISRFILVRYPANFNFFFCFVVQGLYFIPFLISSSLVLAILVTSATFCSFPISAVFNILSYLLLSTKFSSSTSHVGTYIVLYTVVWMFLEKT